MRASELGCMPACVLNVRREGHATARGSIEAEKGGFSRNIDETLRQKQLRALPVDVASQDGMSWMCWTVCGD